jgi:signal transduction histidine kinase
VALVGAILGWLLARSMSWPLRQMALAADRMAQGDYAVRVPDFGSDEMGALGLVINQMAEGMAGVENTRRALVADVSHELRTPLTVIEGYLEGLRSGAIADYQTASRAFDAMYGETRRLLRLVRDLRYLSVLDGGLRQLDCRPTAVHDLLADTVARFAPAAEHKGVHVRAVVPADLPLVSLDPERMAQVLTNLVENALRHTPRGGSITVTGALTGGDLMLTVRDTGDGIAPEHLPYLFERFYRADQARSLTGDGGAGIGLSIVKGIVEALGGNVSIESEPGRGSCFTVRIRQPRQIASAGSEER